MTGNAEAGGGRRRATGRSGQVLIFLVLVLVILAFVVLWNFDLHKILHVKSVTQNGGDAAALMAARWQGITLNLIGDLNLMQAVALSQGDAGTSSAVSNIQARLALAGPMIAFQAAQQAAKNNGIYVNPAFSAYVRAHAQTVRDDYTQISAEDGEMLFPEPYPGAWEEYAEMLERIADDGVAAGPDNARFYRDYAGEHMLLRIDFYEAIAGRNWCWFFHHAPGLLEDYENFFPCWWPPLPELPHVQYVNSEIFGLGLRREISTLAELRPGSTDLWGRVTALASQRGIGSPATNALAARAAWYVYEPGRWSAWDALSPDGPDPFPAAGPVKPPYDYAGADAAVRIEGRVERLSPGAGGRTVTNTILWTAAAKPFGSLEGDRLPNGWDLVLPAFRRVGLIPVDASSAPSGGSFNLDWRRHIEEHLPRYMVRGPLSEPCWYCRQLNVWENRQFRREGVAWLDQYSQRCTVSGPGGGPGRGGGRRRGH